MEFQSWLYIFKYFLTIFYFLQFFFHFIYKILLGKIQLQGKKCLEAKIKTGKILNWLSANRQDMLVKGQLISKGLYDVIQFF